MHLIYIIITLSAFLPTFRGMNILTTFDLTRSKVKEKSLRFYSEFDATKLECASACLNDRQCKTIYLIKPTKYTNNKWRCSLTSDLVDLEKVGVGTGTYGVLIGRSVTNVISPPGIQNGVLISTENNHLGLEASFECSTGHLLMKNVALLFNVHTLKWPDIMTSCLKSLCHQYRLSGTILEDTGDDSASDEVFSGRSICRDDNSLTSGLKCDKAGKWTVGISPSLDCVPTTCFRKNAGGRAVYGGVVRQTDAGVTCQRWDSQTPREHATTSEAFPEDNYNSSLALNYCRDPEGHGSPWCYSMSGAKDWSPCGVSLCR